MPEPIKPEGSKNRDTLVVDLGTKPAKQIKQLRKGKGKLMDKVNECINELKTSGAITGGAQPVVIIVKEKMEFPNFLKMMGST
jgi:hypothetical protein